MYPCPLCQHTMIWQNDYMLSDCTGEETDPLHDRLVQHLTCPNCHADIEITHAPE